MARATDVRPIVKLRSTAGTGYTYVTKKNRRNDPDRLRLTKYDPLVRRHVEFREERRWRARVCASATSSGARWSSATASAGPS